MRPPRSKVEDLKKLCGAIPVAGLGKRAGCSIMLSTGNSKRARAKHVGCSHAPEVGDQTGKRWIRDVHAINIHHWTFESCRGE